MGGDKPDVAKPDVTQPDVTAVAAFLERRHRTSITDVEELPSGFWSSAFAYRVGRRELVLRVGSVPEGFEMDRAASAVVGPELPVPQVLEIGSGLGAAYAISVRHHGRFLESVRPDEAAAAGPALDRLLAALRAAPPVRIGDDMGWQPWLLMCLEDDPSQRVSGWRAKLAADSELDALYDACERRIGELLGVCADRRDLVHGDLLNRNVPIANDASHVTAVYSWKCATRGDFLYDVAWCTFWEPWHPGVAAVDVWARTVASPHLDVAALTDAALRHHCYELHVGARHLAWNAWTGNDAELWSVARRVHVLLDRGPLDPPNSNE